MAEAEPVSKGRDEKNNRDPYLKEPTEGRGLAAFMKVKIIYIYLHIYFN